MRPPKRCVIRTVLCLALSAGVVGAVCAQSSSVRVMAEAEPTTVEVGQTVVFTVTVEGVPATVVQPPEQPAVTNLESRTRRPDTRRVQSSTEGTLRQAVTFSWRFRPEEPGTAHIQPVTVTIRGTEYTTGAIRVQVLDERDLFVRVTATTDRAYQNEQVVAEYRLYYRPGVRLRRSRLAGSWDAPGFWREEFDVASRPTPRRRQAYGRDYETVVLKRVALFPTRPGTLHVEPLRIETEAQGTVRMRRNSPAVRGRFEPVRLASRSLSLEVRPLPSGAPPSFDGAVGQFSMSVSSNADSATVGDPVSLEVQVNGTGLLTTLSAPPLDLPTTVEAYEPTVESDIERGGRRMQGTKTFTYTLVPRSGGQIALPPVVFSYFDPDAERYETLRAEGPTLQVSGEAAPRAVGRTGDGLPVGAMADLITADEAHWSPTDRPPLFRWPWAYVLLLIPVLLVGGGLVYRRWGTALRATSPTDSDPSLDVAQEQLRDVRQRLQNSRPGAESAVYEAVEGAVRTFLKERLGKDRTPLTRSALDRHLARHDTPDDLRDALYGLLDRCDEAQYAPAASRASGSAVVNEAQAVLRRLDEHLPAPENSTEAE
ncbi:MAG: protein BatD [Bacteroidetes bacterium QS_1_63_11]|nr:MAG: protein BatD [Bacteroidetes bacterium QS_1_63_11]